MSESTGTLTLADFLLARIAEKERRVLDHWDSDGKARVATMWTGGEPGYTTVASDGRDDVWVANGHEVEDARNVLVLFDPVHFLAECGAKRRILEMRHAALPQDPSYQGGLEDALKALAAAYADHPDYRDEWKP